MRYLPIIAAALVVSPLAAAAPTAPTYLLAMTLHDGDRVVGSPHLTVSAGQPAKIEIGDAAGNHVSMSVTTAPKTATKVSVASTIDVTSIANGHHSVSPKLVVGLDQPSVIEFGAEGPTDKQFRVDFKVTPTSVS
ncbi:hypothetical protein EAH79_04485 [Sphingomonas koreensis]|nr:hypothetical protein EAH79_04485 [Sphingomonas koreensis]